MQAEIEFDPDTNKPRVVLTGETEAEDDMLELLAKERLLTVCCVYSDAEDEEVCVGSGG